jgi:hypothetical protein
MKLKKTTFDKVDIGEQCLYKNNYGEIIYCYKIGDGVIFYKKERVFTGQFHSCYLIEGLDIIERFFAKFQWYLRRKYNNEEK